MQQLDQIVTSLRDEGFRITPQRIAIVEYILNTEEHPSAEQIHNVVQKRYPMVSLSTVYKTLDLLREKKIVNEIDVDGESRFDAHVDDHINLVCMSFSVASSISLQVRNTPPTFASTSPAHR